VVGLARFAAPHSDGARACFRAGGRGARMRPRAETLRRRRSNNVFGAKLGSSLGPFYPLARPGDGAARVH